MGSYESLITVIVVIFVLFSIALIGYAVYKTTKVKGKARQSTQLSNNIHIGMSESSVRAILGEPDGVGMREDGVKILTYSVDTKNYDSIFAHNTYHVARILIKDGEVVGYENNG